MAGVQGHLATVSSYYENQFLLQMRNSLGNTDVWLGATDKGPGITSLLDGAIVAPGGTEGGNTSGLGGNVLGQAPQAGQRGFGWVWSNGEPMVYSNWAGGEPNGGTGESALQLRGDGLWNDLPAGNTFSADNEGANALASIIEFDLNYTEAQLATLVTPGFNVKVMNAYNGTISGNGARNPFGHLAAADAVINGVQQAGFPQQVVHPLADLTDNGASSQFPGGTQLPGVLNADQYVSVTNGVLNVTVAGNYTFAFAADDGGRLRIDVNGDGQLEDVLIADQLSGTFEMQQPIFLTAGQHAFEWMWFEFGGGAFGELGYRQGTSPVGFNAANYRLVGDAGGGIGTVGQLTTTVYRQQQTDFTLGNINDANNLLNGVTPRGGVGIVRAVTPTINFHGTGGQGQYAGAGTGEQAVPGMRAPGVDDDQFAIEATGFLYIPSAGTWTFNFNSDDGFNLAIGNRVGGGGTSTLEAAPTNANNNGGTMEFPNGRGSADSLGAWTFTAAGFYPITLRSWEGGGGATFELSAAPGDQNSFNGAIFDLVGDTANGGLAVIANMAGEIGTVTIDVTGQNDAPTADAGGAYALNEGEDLVVDASASADIDQLDTLSYSWDLNGDGIYGDFVTNNAIDTVPWAVIDALVPGANNGPGVYNVSVRVSDGLVDVDSATTTLTITNIAPTAGVSTPTPVGVPGQPITFDLTALDPSADDNAAGFTYTIDFGDGPPVMVGPGEPGVSSIAHVYANTGSYTIQVTATDQDGATSLVATVDVTILNVIQLPNGDVVVGGTDLSDRIVFSKGTGSNLIVKITTAGVTSSYGPTPVPANARLIIFGRGGDDTITTSGVTQAAEVDGGDGNDYIATGGNNDTLWGGNGNDRLLGGGGDDLIYGGADNDSIDAGAGNDTVYGEAGVDRLIGGNDNDVLDGGDDADSLSGGYGDGILRGGNDASADTLSGGYGNDLLLGGGGNDRLFGDAGNDVLIGGVGADYFSGGNDNDLLINGTTDQDAASDAALQALLAAWAGSADYSGFVISNDAQMDTMYGGSGADHFFATGFFDKLPDFNAGSGDLLN